MTNKEIEALVDAEEQRLGVGSKEFQQRHDEIMDDLCKIERRNKEDKHAVT